MRPLKRGPASVDVLPVTTLSLCMIVRDEAASLGRCLDSVRGVVDELCVVDTGSTDGTPELARSRGARVAEIAWQDDFAAARNASLELARGDWVLVLDADEELATPGARARLDAFAAARPTAAGQVWIVDRSGAGAEAEAERSAVTRFFPAAGARFEGRVHEQLRLGGAEPVRAPTGVEVRHYGYAPEALRARDKLARNARLLERELAERPDDGYLAWQLGRTRAVAGDPAGALAAFELALARLAPGDGHGAHLVESAGYALRALGRSAEAAELVARHAERWPERPDTCFLRALLDLDLGRLEEADAGFRRCLGLAGRPPAGGPSSPATASHAALHNLGVLREVLGLGDEAADFYRRALAAEPGHGPSRAGLERVLGNAPGS